MLKFQNIATEAIAHYTVTSETVLSFDLEAEDAGQILGISFETNNALSAGTTFQVAGTQSWGTHQAYVYDEALGGTQTITINVGQHFTGNFDRLVFVGDDDIDASTLATFSNLRLVELTVDPRSFAIEAEDHIAAGYQVEARGNSQTNGQLASLLGGGSEGTLAYDFDGEAGLYDIDVFVFDESDGQAEIEILINGEDVNAFVLNQSLGSALVSESNLVTLETEAILLQQGDRVEIRGIQQGAEYARIDRIEFDYVDASDPSVLG